MRLWFFTFLAFGFQRSALHYPTHKIGLWDRSKKPHKLGRPSLKKGAQNGFNSSNPEMIGDILKGYRKFSGLGVRMSTIYRQSMQKVFRCKEAVGPDSYKYFVQPDGLPFPTCRQFSYRVIEHFTIAEVQRIMFGAERARNRLAPSMGRFTESVGNLMERVEADAYTVDEVVSGANGEYLPKLYVVRLRCVTSGMIVGIGFSLGSETGEAYRMALFCAAVGKVWFCALFGFHIEPDEWPSIGLPPHVITDRGPGATGRGQARDAKHRPSSIEIAPSYAGQSKAPVESSHPRAIHLEGQPTFKVTSMNLTQLALREVARAVSDNDSMDVSARLNNEAVVNKVKSTPLGLWAYLDGLSRNDAVTIPWDAAVREYLPEIDLDLRPDGLYFMDQRFDSEALRETGLLDRVATSQVTTVRGYMFSMALRQTFVESPRGLLQVPAMQNLGDNEDQLWLSVAELSQISRLRAEEGSLARPHRQAARAGIEERVEAFTGHPFESRSRRSGRVKRGSAKAKQAAVDAKLYLQPKKGRA